MLRSDARPFVKAGARNVLVTLDSVTSRTADGDGGYTDVYAALTPATAWAAVAPATPSDVERRISAAIEANVSHLVTMPYHSGVNTKTRLTLPGSRILLVRGIRNVDERNVDLELACEEVVS